MVLTYKQHNVMLFLTIFGYIEISTNDQHISHKSTGESETSQHEPLWFLHLVRCARFYTFTRVLNHNLCESCLESNRHNLQTKIHLSVSVHH